jgi:hypothetical protein
MRGQAGAARIPTPVPGAQTCAARGHSRRTVAIGASRAGHLLSGVSDPVLARAFEYWKNIDKELGDKIEQAVQAGKADG